ncbi:autotransporter adhesin family protein [Candidatus Kirkpatrickella diaphorinae]|uniref:Autotransporter adhesin family protein n=1 Tax=Candidatus Kirkpatrickella diaphorinae TaxID=2984322 RepID=A0ABY6GLA7_9PROT|nr:hypothetical protein [Candidatus Kirkpatrickella diaphorinae]UYH51786.1 autotransporter adhesin family protein [Candidatus Kirkpatrickella diaphorinae]
MATITVPGITGQNYQFDAPEEATSALAQQYQDAIAAAVADGTFVAVPPDVSASNRYSVVMGDWIVQSYGTTLDNLADGITNLLIHEGNATASSSFSINATESRQLSILDASTSPGNYLISGAIGGSVSVLEGSCFADFGNATGDWTIAVNAGGVPNSPAGPSNQDGLNQLVSTALNVGGNVINTSSGENYVTVTGARNLIGLGQGNNYLVSQGNDTVYGQGFNVDYLTGAGTSDYIVTEGTTYGTDFVTINGGGGQYDLGQNANVVDAATVGSVIKVQADSSISGGAGSTVTFDNAGGSGTITGAVGDTISAAGNLSVFQGQDHVVSVAGALTFLNGTGNSTLSGGENSTIWGGAGLDAVVTMTGYSIITLNQPGSTGDQTIDASNSTGNIDFWSGAGESFFTGGAGDDHMVFGTAFSGASGDSTVTVTGGEGANSFGVLAGHSGGNITITDFDASRGDYFFQYFYNPIDSALAVQNLLATATVSGGNTILQLDNNMQVTFLGVEHLDASAIHIS